MIPGYGQNQDYQQEWADPLAADPAALVDWDTFWRAADQERDWIVPGILPVTAGCLIYSEVGKGKSLLALEWGACLSMGEPVLGEPVKARTVLYVDLENDACLVRDRLESLGCGPGSDLRRFHYSLLGEWLPLDTAEGGAELLRLVQRLGADLVIIDTAARVISGEENTADTFFALYRHALRPLKAAGAAVIRLDHAGKKLENGARGSSAKGSDVDLVYRLTETDTGLVTLKREKNRLHLDGPELVTLRRKDNPLRHEHATGNSRLRDIIATAADLDRLGAPLDISRRKAQVLLATAGVGRRETTTREALNYRRASGEGGSGSPYKRGGEPGAASPGTEPSGSQAAGATWFDPTGTGWETVPP